MDRALGQHRYTPQGFHRVRCILIYHQESSDMNHIRMGSLVERLHAMVGPARGSSAAADTQLPRTRQDVILEETGRRAQASVSNPRLTPINTAIEPAIRKYTLGSPLSGKTLYGDELDEPQEKQQNDGNVQESKAELPVDSPNQEEEPPLKYPIAPQHCRRWGKPESYVLFSLFTRFSDGMRG